MSNKKNISVLLGVAVLAVVGFFAYTGFKGEDTNTSGNNSTVSHTNESTVSNNSVAESSSEPPVLAKNIGFNLDYYNPATKKAGDFAFSNIPALDDPLVGNMLWMDYGVPDPKPGSTMKNPQTVFILPAGTKITAMVDGEVVSLQEFAKDDYGLMIAKDASSAWRYEHEHIAKPTVKVGDTVKAGDVIAEVAQHVNTWQYPGHGLFEIGLYRAAPGGGGGGSEDCVFKFLDPSVKKDVEAKVSSVYKGWEEFRGDALIYDQENYASPGCAILETISWDTPMVPGGTN